MMRAGVAFARQATISLSLVGLAVTLTRCTSPRQPGHAEVDAAALDATVDAVPTAEAASGDADGDASSFDAGAGVTVLAINQQDPSFIALDPTSVYWTNYDVGRTFVMKMPLGGGVPVTLAIGPGEPFGLAVDGANVYWTQSVSGSTGNVMSVPVGGGPPVPLVVGQVQPVGPAVDVNGIYWSEASDDAGLVMKASLDGGGPSVVASVQDAPNAIAMDATSVYWISPGGIFRAPLDGGAPTLLGTSMVSSGAIAVDSTAVYSSSSFCSIQRTPLDGGASGPLITEPPGLPACQNGGGIVADGTSVYWAIPLSISAISNLIRTGEIVSAPVGADASLALTVLATGQNGPNSVAVDGTHVYWTNSGANGQSGQVMMAPK